MDGECAFCGRADEAVRLVFCDDCQAHHQVCKPCADEGASATEGYRLVA